MSYRHGASLAASDLSERTYHAENRAADLELENDKLRARIADLEAECKTYWRRLHKRGQYESTRTTPVEYKAAVEAVRARYPEPPEVGNERRRILERELDQFERRAQCADQSTQTSSAA